MFSIIDLLKKIENYKVYRESIYVSSIIENDLIYLEDFLVTEIINWR